MKGRTLIVLHIPKTAGTSLLSIARRQYPRGAVREFAGADWARQVADFARTPASALETIACLMGHVPFGVHRLLPGPASYVTLLREPVDWTLSLYYALLTKPQADARWRVVAERAMSLDAFVEFLAENGRDNPQTRLVGGFVAPERLLEPQPPLTAGALETARANLAAHFAVAGVVEHFDASLLLMQQALGWGSVYYAQRNVTARRPRQLPLTDAQRRRILECHHADAALYESTRAELLRRVQALEPGFGAKLERFRRRNALYARLHGWYRRSMRLL